MLIDALVPIDCRAASFRHLPSRRRATIIPITRPPLLTLIDAPFSPGLSRYTHQLRDVKMDNIWANLPETRQSRANNAAAASADMQPGRVSGRRAPFVRYQGEVAIDRAGTGRRMPEVAGQQGYALPMRQKSGVDDRIAPDAVMNCQLPATAGARRRLENVEQVPVTTIEGFEHVLQLLSQRPARAPEPCPGYDWRATCRSD
jgi:hypothetical protein